MHRSIFAALGALLWAFSGHAQTLADFERIDGNKDGFITLNEFEAARQRDFELLDANKDGSVSREEFVNPRGGDPGLAQLRERRFRQLDGNGDGRISRQEYLAYGRRIFTQLDGDRDGRISRTEFEAALAGGTAPPPAERPRRGPGQSPSSAAPPAATAFDEIDTNRDGFITPNELDAARTKAFRQLDTNGDGRLTRDEITAQRGSGAAARLAEMDRDGDGTVTLREFLDAGRADFRAADANPDGKLSREEFARGQAR